MILHIDMDAFYASVELRDRPELVGKPVVVGGSPQGRGVISAASYEARKFGIHSAMSAAEALRRCPEAVFVKPRMDHYAAISKQIRKIFFSFTSLVEPIAFDEAFLDVGGSQRLFGDAVSIADQIKRKVKLETGLIASAGVAPNKFLAKLASDLDKPDGLTVVDPKHIQEFLDPLPIHRVWGIGRVTESKFKSMGVSTIADMRMLTSDQMKARFGINGDHFWKLSRGIDSRSVVPDRYAKSISHETTFSIDVSEIENLRAWSMELSDQVARRMRRFGILGRTVNLKVRFGNFKTITRAHSLAEPSSCSAELGSVVSMLVLKTLGGSGTVAEEFKRQSVRLIGVGVSKLKIPNEKNQLWLFDQEKKHKQMRVDEASDQIKEKFGHHAVRRASSVAHNIRHRRDPLVDD